nr:hypothetical protein [Tanacetum cinerariifolium]
MVKSIHGCSSRLDENREMGEGVKGRGVWRDIARIRVELEGLGIEFASLCRGERKPKKGQNRIKTGQKREAWRSREKSEAVTVYVLKMAWMGQNANIKEGDSVNLCQ